MCGIVGYVGCREAQPILIDCLKRLEYRGYDSCGVALTGSKLSVHKDAVRIDALGKTLKPCASTSGIGHTRWATHGKPSQANAHPHSDCSGKIAVVHNGVINNYLHLRETLINEGHIFSSETDTEVIPHLIEKYYSGDLERAACQALNDLSGSYAVIVIHADCEHLVVARQGSPLIIGIGDKENLVASDVPAVLEYTDRVMYLEDGDFGVVGKDMVRLSNSSAPVTRQEHTVAWTVEQAQKSGYDHFMIKEIHEQPRVIRNTYAGFLSAVDPEVDLGLRKEADFNNILILACGTSYHAALVGKHCLERVIQTPVTVDMATEFNYSCPVIENCWVIIVTQSGETADCLKAIRKAREYGCRTLVITNVVGSTATRVADEVLYINAGPEISVAATKSFTAQLTMLYLLALSRASGDISSRTRLIAELRQLPNKVHEVLDRESEVEKAARYLQGFQNVFFVGRGINYAIALEGALKIKEIAYIHAEGYAAGELKHGPFALLTQETPVIAIAARDLTYEALLANIKEIKARESPVIAIAEEDDFEIEKYVDLVLRVPGTDPLFTPVLNTVVLQLLAYYTAKERGCSIDTPRNLAKSVTVE